MSIQNHTHGSLVVSLAAGIIALVVLSAASARAGDCCSSHNGSSGQSHGAHGGIHQHGEHQTAPTRPASIASQPPHGGQVSTAAGQYFEVVYLQHETRVYLYGEDQRPVNAGGVQGQVAMKVRGNDYIYRYPLQPVAAMAGLNTENCLAAAVDVRKIRDGDMGATFDLANLPNSRQSSTSFTQVFALTRVPATVTIARLDESDRAAIARQRVCPVTSGTLGSMGSPVKLLIGDQPLYLCCQGCVAKVRANPEQYVTHPMPSAQRASQAVTGGKVTVTQASATDQAAVKSQGTCAVRGTPLGSMGTPVKVTRGDQSLFLCCQGCVPKVEKNPDYYFAQAGRLTTGR